MYSPCVSLPELDALGDDFLTEDDSYLDNLEGPEPPSGLPVDSTVKSKVRAHLYNGNIRKHWNFNSQNIHKNIYTLFPWCARGNTHAQKLDVNSYIFSEHNLNFVPTD